MDLSIESATTSELTTSQNTEQGYSKAAHNMKESMSMDRRVVGQDIFGGGLKLWLEGAIVPEIPRERLMPHRVLKSHFLRKSRIASEDTRQKIEFFILMPKNSV